MLYMLLPCHAFPKVSPSANVAFTCGCDEGASTEAEREIECCIKDDDGKQHQGRDPGLKGLRLLRYCTDPRHMKCNVTKATQRPLEQRSSVASAGASDDDRRSNRIESAAVIPVAWVLTGAIRSFFSPVVHQSIYQNAIRAVGGEPRVFFIASLADDPKQGREAVAVGNTHSQHQHSCAQPDLEHCSPAGCAAAYANLSSFVAAHPSTWGAVTAHIEEETAARQAHAVENPSCPLPSEFANTFTTPHYLGQSAQFSAGFRIRLLGPCSSLRVDVTRRRSHMCSIARIVCCG